jgi:hypothetical protein
MDNRFLDVEIEKAMNENYIIGGVRPHFTARIKIIVHCVSKYTSYFPMLCYPSYILLLEVTRHATYFGK